MNEKDMETIVRNVLAAVKPAKAPAMHLDLALALMKEVEAEAERIGIKIVVAIVDAAGHPVAVHCMDGAYIGSYDVAVNKAFTSVAFKMSTETLGKLAAPGESLYGIQLTNQGRIVIFGGGEPLYVDDILIGSIGVSGGSAEQDSHLSTYGKNKLKDVITWK